MWFKNSYRRHLCDMHIEDWNPEFLKEFDPEIYLENLKRAKIQSAMIYLQSHVGLCYFPTRSGAMHKAWEGREDVTKRLIQMCRKEGIRVTGYYSLIYNNWAHDAHPEWRMLQADGKSLREEGKGRYGLCCLNNPEYREFVSEQIHEIVDYFEFDGMFFDMLFWPHLCYCEHCQARWEREIGGRLPEKEDWTDPDWLLHIQKRREWMGAYAQSVTDELKSLAPHASVEHNFASGVLPNGLLGAAEPVNDACDYTGGDLYGGILRQSFTCKFYRNITKNQPFEYMFSRCSPTLAAHTVTKSRDEMRSAVFLTASHHGATLVIDAIDPVGTMDERVYRQIGTVFTEEIPYETFYTGDMIEDVGIYYTLNSKFNAYGESHSNHDAAVNVMDTFVTRHISCGVTGGYHDLDSYKVLIAPLLTDEDAYDNERILEYVKNGGLLYFSGAENRGLLKAFFDGRYQGRTRETITYIAPKPEAETDFDYFNAKYPLHFNGSAPVVDGIDEKHVLSHITLPYTARADHKFVSIHSDPPGVATSMPAMAYRTYGKGRVFWSALPIEDVDMYDYRRIFLNLLHTYLPMQSTVMADAPRDVEVVSFRNPDSVTVNIVLLCEEHTARRVEPFTVRVQTDTMPHRVVLLPAETEIPYSYEGGMVTFRTRELDVFDMYRIEI